MKNKTEVDKFNFNKVEGLTKLLEERITQSNVQYQDIITSRNVVNMSTYKLAVMALENNSPEQLIRVIEAMKKKHSKSKNFTDDARGFLEDIEGKAYAYIAASCKNEEDTKNYSKRAHKCFVHANSLGYKEALLDDAELIRVVNGEEAFEDRLMELEKNNPGASMKLGEFGCDLSTLVDGAMKVLNGEDIDLDETPEYKYAMSNYRNGADKDINSKICACLGMIIDGDKKLGLRLLNMNFLEFKNANANARTRMFSSDAKIMEENISNIESKILKINKR